MSSGSPQTRCIAFVGLASAGKTSTLRRLVHGEFTPPRGPTMGFNVDSFTYRGIHVQAFDLGGQSPFIHTFWKSFIPRAEAIVFVVDSAHPSWFKKSRDNLEFCLGWAQTEPILIILANKQDLPEAASIDELMQYFELESIAEHDIRGLQLFATSAKTGKGIREAFDWLAGQLVGDIELPKIHLHNIYVYRRDTPDQLGAMNPLLNARIGGVKEDATLITGFYSAIEAFASQIGGRGIKTLVVENPGSEDYRFTQVEDEKKNLACLVVVNERDPLEAVENVAREALLVAREEIEYSEQQGLTVERVDEEKLVSRIEPYIHIAAEEPVVPKPKAKTIEEARITKEEVITLEEPVTVKIPDLSKEAEKISAPVPPKLVSEKPLEGIPVAKQVPSDKPIAEPIIEPSVHEEIIRREAPKSWKEPRPLIITPREPKESRPPSGIRRAMAPIVSVQDRIAQLNRPVEVRVKKERDTPSAMGFFTRITVSDRVRRIESRRSRAGLH